MARTFEFVSQFVGCVTVTVSPNQIIIIIIIIIISAGRWCCRSLVLVVGAGRSARHHQINDFVYRSLSRANFPAKREPPRLLKSDCKRPDGITLIPWREGKCLAWDATVGDTFMPTYLSATSVKAGAAADHLASKKRIKYADLRHNFYFCPIAVETMGPIEDEGAELLTSIGRYITKNTGDPRESSFLFQRLSIIIQRRNAAAFKGTFIIPAIDVI